MQSYKIQIFRISIHWRIVHAFVIWKIAFCSEWFISKFSVQHIVLKYMWLIKIKTSTVYVQKNMTMVNYNTFCCTTYTPSKTPPPPKKKEKQRNQKNKKTAIKLSVFRIKKGGFFQFQFLWDTIYKFGTRTAINKCMHMCYIFMSPFHV